MLRIQWGMLGAWPRLFCFPMHCFQQWIVRQYLKNKKEADVPFGTSAAHNNNQQ
jgi:hypothetical protein